MAGQSELLTDVILEDKIADIWPDYPCLYDVRSADFKNRDMREKAFQEISEKLQKPVDWVRIKLKALRNSYTKAKKPGPSGSARKTFTKRATWLLEKLQFLAPHVATRTSLSNIDSGVCSTPTSEISLDENFEEDDQSSGQPSTAGTPSPLFDNELDETPRSTKEPLTLKPNRKRQAEEEFKLIQGLAQSISERKSKAQKSDKPASNPVESFGQYVAQSLSELDTGVRHLAQHKISQILFQAQTGSLENPYGSMAPIRPQPYFFQPDNTQYSQTGINNQAVSTYSQFNVQQQRSSPQNDSLCHNVNAPAGIWRWQNVQSDHTPEDGH